MADVQGASEQSQGNVSHGATDFGMPIKIGGKAILGGGLPAAVSDNQRVNALFDEYGRQGINSFHSRSGTEASWTNATAQNAALSLSTKGLAAIVFSFVPSGTISGGVLTFEVSGNDGGNWFPVQLVRVDNYNVDQTFNMNGAASTSWQASVAGYTNFRVRLSTVISGTGTAVVRIESSAAEATRALSVGQPTASNLNAQMQGNVAHDAVDSGNPSKIGAKAVAHGASPSAVAAGDRTDLYANRHGIQFTIGGHPNTETPSRKDTTAQTDTILKAVSAGQKFVITAVIVLCDKANTVDVQALLEWDDASDVRIFEHGGIEAGGGFSHGNGGESSRSAEMVKIFSGRVKSPLQGISPSRSRAT
jgi:hypothetical protein